MDFGIPAGPYGSTTQTCQRDKAPIKKTARRHTNDTWTMQQQICDYFNEAWRKQFKQIEVRCDACLGIHGRRADIQKSGVGRYRWAFDGPRSMFFVAMYNSEFDMVHFLS